MTSVEKDKKPHYKEYVHFLDNYKNGKKDECELTTSTNEELPTKSFKEYLQDYNNKKYQPVQPNFVKKNVKTEVFIQINNNNNKNNENQIKITIPKPKIDDVDGEQTKKSFARPNNNFCVKRSSSITEKTKLFEEKPKETTFKKPNGHKLNPTFIEIRKQELQNIPNTPPPQLPLSSERIPSTITPPKEINTKSETNCTNGAIPPPPPLPPVNLPPKSTYVSNSSPKSFNVQPKQTKVQTNGYSTLPKMQNNKKEPVDTTNIDKNDPRVKKLVYGALRGMYGAYHDKANDYLATLPKNRVKKGNGLDSIINSIAAQGGLEKLSGRANPKSEIEQT